MLLKDHSDFLLQFSGTQEPGRRKFSISNVMEAKRLWGIEKNKRDMVFVVAYTEGSWVKLNLLLKTLGILRGQ